MQKNFKWKSKYKYNHDRGIVKTGIHRYRHTAAKKFILAGKNPAILQKSLSAFVYLLSNRSETTNPKDITITFIKIIINIKITSNTFICITSY